MNDEPPPVVPPPGDEDQEPHKAAVFFTWVFLLRVPLIITVIACVLPSSVIFKWGPSQMVRGAYDASPLSFGILLLAVSALAFSLHMITHVILNAGHLRYRVSKMSRDDVNGWDNTLLAVYFWVPIIFNIWACMRVVREADMSWSRFLAYLGWGIAGMVPALFSLGLSLEAEKTRRRQQQGVSQRVSDNLHGSYYGSPRNLLLKLMGVCVDNLAKWFGPGFGGGKKADGTEDFEEAAGGGRVRNKHIMAATMCTGAWAIYLIIGFGDLPGLWSQRDVAAINYVFTLLIAFTWALTSMTFVLDRYRIPLISVLIGIAFLGGLSPRADYGFKTQEAKIVVKPKDILGQQGAQIMVAAEGGGIHSGSWAAEVLATLEEMSRDPMCRPFDVPVDRKSPAVFSHSVRAVSGVSGGSYGLMFFADAYSDGQIPEKRQPKNNEPPKASTVWMREMARRSSLGNTVHGLVFADFWHGILPIWRTEGRARSMEDAWVEDTDLAVGKDGNQTSMAKWADDALAQHRPVVLFNSTGVESGRPVVFGSSQVRDWTFQGAGAVTPQVTVPVSTGARLSAAFPFVSPAARPKEDAPKGQITEHHVDGGYYDNFGIVTLMQWVNEGLKELVEAKPGTASAGNTTASDTVSKRLLFIQIRYHDGAADASKPQQGSLYQSSAPLLALYNVRTTGQKLRNNEQFLLFTDYWNNMGGISIDNALFEFDGSAALSWHLTQSDKKMLDDQGKRIRDQYLQYREALKKHQALLKGMPTEERERTNQQKEDVRASELELNKLPLGGSAYLVMKFLWENSVP